MGRSAAWRAFWPPQNTPRPGVAESGRSSRRTASGHSTWRCLMPSGFTLRSLFNIQKVASRHAIHAAVLAAALTAGVATAHAAAAAAEPAADAGAGEIETGKYQFEGTLSRP